MSAPRRRLLRALLWIGAALLALQFTLSIGFYLYDNTRTTAGAVQIYGDASPASGTSTPLYVGWIERYRGFREDAEVVAHLDGRTLEVTGPDHSDPMGLLEVPLHDGPTEVTFTVEVPGQPAREAELTLTPTTPTPWIDSAERYRGRGVPRRPDLTADANDQPRVYLVDVETSCPWTFTVTPETGIATRNVRNRLWVQLHDEGTPVSGVRVDITPPPEGGPAPSTDHLVTGPLGLASVTVTPLSSETWGFTFECGEHGPVTRELTVVPSWDGLQLLDSAPSVQVGGQLRMSIAQQRSFGVWYLDIVCDGGWVYSHVHGTRPGTTELRLNPRLPTPSGGVGLCIAQAATGRLNADPSRSVRYFLVRDADTSERAALLILLDAWSRYSEDAHADTLGPALRSALMSASDEQVRSLGVWLLSQLPQPYEAIAQLYDDHQSVSDAFQERQHRVRRSLITIMLVDGLILLIAVLLILVPAAITQRQRFAAFAADDVLDDTLEDDATHVGSSALLDQYRDVIAITVIVGIIGGFAFGIMTLLYYLR